MNDSQSDVSENRAGKSEKALLNAVLILVSFTKRCCAEDDGQPASGEKVMIVEIRSNILSCIFQIYARGTTCVVVSYNDGISKVASVDHHFLPCNVQ